MGKVIIQRKQVYKFTSKTRTPVKQWHAAFTLDALISVRLSVALVHEMDNYKCRLACANWLGYKQP